MKRLALCLCIVALVLPGVAQADEFPLLTLEYEGRGVLAADGRSVLVPIQVTCEGLPNADFLVISMSVTQSREAVVQGQGLISQTDDPRLPCDGRSRRFVVRVIAESSTYRVGSAEATMDGQVCWFGPQSGICTGEGGSVNSATIRLVGSKQR